VTDAAVPARSGPSVLLIVSLCVNVALIALVAIAVLRAGPRTFEPRKEGALGAHALMRMVPAETAKIQAVIDSHHQRMRELREQAMQARAESFRALTASEFDAGAFAKSLAAVQNADAALEAESLKVTADSVAVLTPAEREHVAGKVEKPDRVWLRRFFRRR